METLNYCDSQLRDLADSWVIFSPTSSQPSRDPMVTQEVAEMIGYLHLNRDRGFQIIVHGEIGHLESGELAISRSFVGPHREIAYDQVKQLSLRPLTKEEFCSLALPTRPNGTPGILDSNLLRCRKNPILDPFRVAGNPDVVRVWLKVGTNCRGEEVLARLESEQFEDIYKCTIVSQPACSHDFPMGTKVIVVRFEIHDEGALYCVWTACDW